MTTTKIRAGTVYGCAFKDCTRPAGPCAGNCLLHRVDTSTLPAQTVATVTPQGCTGDCRQGRDCTCQAETVSEFSADVMTATWLFWLWSALIWTACWLGIGYFFGRHFA
jgi:hypothetical protein